MRPFRFAIQGLAFLDRSELTRSARHIEALGYDELYSYDHLGAADPFVPLAVVAATTQRLGVGPLVLNNEFHQPVLLARTAATLDALSHGRLVLGMGTGYAEHEHRSAGIPLRDPSPRLERFRECLTILRSLLDTGACHVEGEYHQVHVDDLGLRPTNAHVPLLIGGHGRRLVGLAAEFADIFQFTGLVHASDGTPTTGGFAFDEVRRRAEWLDASPRADAIERSTLVQVVEFTDDGAARSAEIAQRLSMDPAAMDDCPFVLIGSVGQVVDKLQRLRELLGISHVVVRDADAFAPVVAELAGR